MSDGGDQTRRRLKPSIQMGRLLATGFTAFLLLFALGDATDCARVVREVLDRPDEAERLALAAQSEVRRDFSMAYMVEAHSSLYRDLVARRRR